MERNDSIHVLLIEDDSEDAELLEDAVKADGRIELRTVGDGEKAVDYLKRKGDYSGVPRPDLILLDLHLPKKPGLQVLREIKRDKSLRVIPVITFTSSTDDEDVWDAYSAGAACYLSKPVGLGALCELVALLSAFWSLAKLPQPAR